MIRCPELLEEVRPEFYRRRQVLWVRLEAQTILFFVPQDFVVFSVWIDFGVFWPPPGEGVVFLFVGHMTNRHLVRVR